MRKILFRGKRIDSGEWVEGHYGEYMLMSGESIPCISIPNKEAVCGSTCCDVEASTVGQYTGLTDKNSKKVFEGDIVAAKSPIQKEAVPCLVGFGEFEDVNSLDNYNYMGWFLKAYGKCLSILEPEKDGIEFEVIGNIHDNPELLKVMG